MAVTKKLSKNMTVRDFDNGYWYATEIKAFAIEVGISPVSSLRKDELEDLIRHFLRTKIVKKVTRRTCSPDHRDSASRLTRKKRIRSYTNDDVTKSFLEEEARKIDPSYRRKSGARYRLNRWREDQMKKGRPITYGDLVREYVRLSKHRGAFPKARSGRYINFLSDFLSNEAGATRDQAIAAWQQLKTLDTPKDYASWKKYMRSKQKRR